MNKNRAALTFFTALSLTCLSVLETKGNKAIEKPTLSQPSVPVISKTYNKSETYRTVFFTDDSSSELSIISAGDILFHMPQVISAEVKNGYDFNPMFSEIKTLVQSKDIAVANFETTVNPNKKPSGYPCFNTPVQALEAIKATGFDILLNNNNHSLDTGLEGLRSTTRFMKEYGFKVVGAGDPEEDKTVVIERNGIKVALLSYTYGTNFGIKYPDMINYIDEEKISEDIIKVKSKSDFIIVYLHLGTEYVRSVEDFQQKLVNNIAEMGADAILCSHPHVARKTEFLKVNGREVLVNYSMGNFISNQNDKYTDIGSMQNIILEKKGNITRIKASETIPIYRLRYSYNGKKVYKAIVCKEAGNFTDIIGKAEVNYINTVSSQLAFSYEGMKLPPIRMRASIEVFD